MEKSNQKDNVDQLLGACEAPGCVGIASRIVEMGALNAPKNVKLCWECLERLDSRARQRGYPNYMANRNAAISAFKASNRRGQPNNVSAKL
jgi:hypothetical protein